MSFCFDVSVVHLNVNLQVAYHQRMNLATNIGLVVLFSFAPDLQLNYIRSLSQAPNIYMWWLTKARRLKPGSTCWIAIPCGSWIDNLLNIVLKNIVSSLLLTDRICLIQTLRSRGSTHRSYWRASGKSELSSKHSLVNNPLSTFRRKFAVSWCSRCQQDVPKNLLFVSNLQFSCELVCRHLPPPQKKSTTCRILRLVYLMAKNVHFIIN